MNIAVPWRACLCFLTSLTACGPRPPGSLELQRRCDREAGAWFQAQHPDGVTLETVDRAIHTRQYTFSDHYNPRLQRCFVIASEQKSTVYPDQPSAGSTGKSLVDLDTNTRLGEVVDPWPMGPARLQICHLASARCASTQEWEALAAPYMER